MSSDTIHAVIKKRSSKDPMPQPIGYVPGTTSEFFLRRLLEARGLSIDLTTYELVSLHPPGIVSAFNVGDIKSAVIWEPYVSEISRSKKPPYDTLPELEVDKHKNLYPFQLYLITSKVAWATRKDKILKFVATIRDACARVSQNPEDAQSELEHIFGYPKGWLNPIWGDMDFSFSLDKQVLRTPIDLDAELAIKSGLITSMPRIDPLFAILPDVTASLGLP